MSAIPSLVGKNDVKVSERLLPARFIHVADTRLVESRYPLVGPERYSIHHYKSLKQAPNRLCKQAGMTPELRTGKLNLNNTHGTPTIARSD